jgi:hypothetical protein
MSFVKNTQPQRMRKASKRVLLGETREEEAARLEREIAAHPVTRCLASITLPHRAIHSAFRAELSPRGSRR